MRTIIKLTVLLIVVASFSPPAAGAREVPPGGSFVDDDLSIHQSSIEAIAVAGITRGCNPPANTRFCPDDAVTRSQMAAFLARALDLPAAPPAGFADISATLFRQDIDRLVASAITRGCNPPQNDRFCPEDRVTRGQMAAFLSRALQLPEHNEDSFYDDDTSTFEADIERLHAAGITAGCNPPDNNAYCPDRSVTRAEMATFLARALGLEVEAVPNRPYVIDVVPRDAWGAAEPIGPLIPHSIEWTTIHHGGSLDGATGPAQFRAWQRWHQALGWPDLAYHFIVGRDGRVYEGRPYATAGDTATEYHPAGHFLIVVEGNFDVDTPTADQLEMTARLAAWASLQFEVPPVTIAGHRDHAATRCPGDNLHALIADGSLRIRTESILSEGGVTLRLQGAR